MANLKAATLSGPAKLLQDAVAAHRQGRTDSAIDLARSARKHGGAIVVDADVVIAEALFRAGRIDELRVHLDQATAFKADRRWPLMAARAERSGNGDQARCEELLLTVLKPEIADPVDRMAAFELVKLYEKQGRHDEAWTVAEAAHRRTTQRFDTDALVRSLEASAKAAADGRLAKMRRASRPVHRAAFIFGMPRSGTTLIEQMLDCHPLVRGVGELQLHGLMESEIAFEGGGTFPEAAVRVQVATLDRWQGEYRKRTRDFHKLASAVWTLDKSVFPGIMPLPLAAVFPGAKVICVRRDARDNAVSLFLNNLDTVTGWTSSLDTIRRVIVAQRTFAVAILHAAGIETIDVRLEHLVDAPEPHARAMLTHLGLDWNPACLHPEQNTRVVHTLSHEQVRRPINRDGTGRWKNHARRFDSSWDALD